MLRGSTTLNLKLKPLYLFLLSESANPSTFRLISSTLADLNLLNVSHIIHCIEDFISMTILKGKGSKSHKRNGHSNSSIRLAVDEQESSIELRNVDNNQSDEEIKSSFRSLFAFTTKKHTLNLVLCIIFAVVSGVLKPISAIFYGNIFGSLTNYGGGVITAQETLHRVSNWCIAISVLGGAVWLFEGLFLCSWVIFGELQARSVREKMFVGMLEKDLEWFDLRKDGIGSLLIRIET